MIRRGLCLLALIVPLSAQQLPPDAAALKSKRDARISEINRNYAAELEKLQKKAMQAGNLEAANTIQKEIEAVTVDPFDEGKEPSVKIEGVWNADFVGSKVVRRTFTKSHLVDELGGKHSYTVKGDTITIEWGGGLWEKLKINRKLRMS